jgi:4'-phosphopantetheinyl transferase
LRFNLSHSEEQAVLALTLGREIGVDIERTRSDVACDEIAQRFFSPAERDQLRATPPDLQIAAFFRVWTCKEAFLKAHGAGLTVSLDSFEVEADPAKPPALLATRPDPREAVCWSLRHLDVPPGFAAAVAVRGQLGNVQSMVWQ